jgi:hypothetical protein
LSLVFVLDFLFQPNVAIRLIFLTAAAASLLFAWRKLVQPWLGRHETELDLALLVQCHQRRMAASGDLAGHDAGVRLGMARDFAAALQFEGPQGAKWGSVRLEQLVIDDVATASSWLNVFEGFSTRQIARRAAVAAAALAVVVAAVAWYPAHARAFANRLLLGAAHYPSRTVLAKLAINGRDVPLENGVSPAATKCAEGQPVRLVLSVAGELPDAGKITASTAAGRNFEIDLARQKPTAKVGQSQHEVYVATIDRLGEPLTYQIALGDAWTDPATIDLIELPVVECTLSPIPPAYVSLENNKQSDLTGVRNIEALEGSSIDVEVACRNKPLARVAITIDDQAFPLLPVDNEHRRWRLDSKNTPLAAIDKETRYKLTIADVDDLPPQHAIEGVIRIKLDRPPSIAAIVRTRHVVPDAAPVVECRATDDYGLAKLVARAVVVRESPDGKDRHRREPVTLFDGQKPLTSGQLPLDAKYPLPLSQFKLTKGDQLELVLEVVDYRGQSAGKAASTEPIVLSVTDADGVASAVAELDPKLEAQFDTLIQRQLDIGASK